MHLLCLQLEPSCLQWLFPYNYLGELLCLQLSLLCLQLELFCLQLELSCLRWENASNKHLNGLQANMSTASTKVPNVSQKGYLSRKVNLLICLGIAGKRGEKWGSNPLSQERKKWPGPI